MKKKIVSALVLLAITVPMSASIAASSFTTDLINANKNVINNAASKVKSDAKAKADANSKAANARAAKAKADAKAKVEKAQADAKAKVEKAKADANSKANAQVKKYQNQILAKQAELNKVKSDSNITAIEKAKKIKAINDEIKELQNAIKALN